MLNNRTKRQGVAAVEFAFLIPVLLVFLLGVWEVGRLLQVMQILTNAAREGGRQASTGNMTVSQIQTYVVNCLNQYGISSATAGNVTVTNTTHPGVDPTQASQLDELVVTISIPFDSVRWVLLQQVTGVTTLSVSASWNSARDIPVTVNTTVPLN